MILDLLRRALAILIAICRFLAGPQPETPSTDQDPAVEPDHLAPLGSAEVERNPLQVQKVSGPAAAAERVGRHEPHAGAVTVLDLIARGRGKFVTPADLGHPHHHARRVIPVRALPASTTSRMARLLADPAARPRPGTPVGRAAAARHRWGGLRTRQAVQGKSQVRPFGRTVGVQISTHPGGGVPREPFGADDRYGDELVDLRLGDTQWWPPGTEFGELPVPDPGQSTMTPTPDELERYLRAATDEATLLAPFDDRLVRT